MIANARTRTDGFTLIEVMLVMTLFLVILGATLEASTLFTRHNALAERRTDQAEQARTALDRQARQLRNLAQRVDAPTINRATGYDVIFQTSDPARTWVRYCLDTTQVPATPARGRLWEMVSDSTTVPSSGACSKGSWQSAAVVADYVANRKGGGDRPVFSYSCLGAVVPCPPADYSRVTGIGATLFVDDDVTRAPNELRVTTSVYLRNQNEPPTAVIGEPQYPRTRTVFLNASGSSDPEGRTLRYYWFPTATPPSFRCQDGPPSNSNFYQGVTLTYTFASTIPTTTTPTRPFTLVVCDPGFLQSVSATKLVRVPA